jgi:hypothetical protein
MRGFVAGVTVGLVLALSVAWAQTPKVRMDTSGGPAKATIPEGRVRATCEADEALQRQLDRLEILANATLVGHEGETFGKRGWNAFSAFEEARKTQPKYLNPGTLKP